MRVLLKVVGGKNDGREIRIGVPEFIIGRGEDAHLKPTSDLVSRVHCVVKISGGKVVIEDMKSRNGTFVNGQQLEKAHFAKSGDTLRVGRLQFEVVIDPVQSGNKKPKVDGVVDAAARTAAKAPGGALEDSISDWLNEDDDMEKVGVEREQYHNADTIQMSLEDTASFGSLDKESDSDSSESLEDEMGEGKSKKKKPGKLPPIPKFSHDDSKTAADDVLRRFFNRR